MTLSNLKVITDEIYLRGIFERYGPVEEIVLKKRVEKEKHEKYEIGGLVYVFQNISDDRITIEHIKRKNAGLRKANMKFRNILSLQHAYQELNGVVGSFGTSRLHLKPHLTYLFRLTNKEKEIIDHKMAKDEMVQNYIASKMIKIKTEISDDEDEDIGGKCILRLIAFDVNLFVNIKDRVWAYLEGKILTLTSKQIKKK